LFEHLEYKGRFAMLIPGSLQEARVMGAASQLGFMAGEAQPDYGRGADVANAACHMADGIDA
jgi:hypothetical protein